MSESIFAFVLENLQATKGQWAAVAKGSKVPKRTIEKIARREIKDPGVTSIERLANYFRQSSRKKAH